MALEQAQQQFDSASKIGYESRPLNLFYGLSQAGRAVAAGSPLLGGGAEHQWQATGDGLKFDPAVPQGVFATPVRQETGPRDLFSRASIALGSPLDFGEVLFGAVLSQVTDYTMTFQESDGYLRPIYDVHVYGAGSKSFPIEVEVRVPGLSAEGVLPVAEVQSLLAPYPALDGLELALDDSGNVRRSHNNGRCFVLVPGPDYLMSRNSGESVHTLKGATAYRGTTVILPRTGASAEPLRPLMSWWLMLYALSMLARYSPGNWTRTLSISESPIASRIEFILDTAIDAVPELLWDELFSSTKE